MSLADAVSTATRALRADPRDRAAFARLLVDLWRWGGFSSAIPSKREWHVVFRLDGGVSGAQRRRGQEHPWGSRKIRRDGAFVGWNRGLWWTIQDGAPWNEPGPWIMASTNDGQRILHSREYSKRFESGSELAEYVHARAREWRCGADPRAWEITSEPLPDAPLPPCPEGLGPSRVPCGLREGHAGRHEWAVGR